jgi:hypothetical protein
MQGTGSVSVHDSRNKGRSSLLVVCWKRSAALVSLIGFVKYAIACTDLVKLPAAWGLCATRQSLVF